MITLYFSPSCTSCRKARQWIESHNMAYIGRNVGKEPLKASDIRAMLRLTEDGTDEILSRRSKVFSKLNIDLDSISTNSLIELIVKNPSLLKRPVIMDDRRIQVGYNEDEIRRFLPREVRQRELLRVTVKADFKDIGKALIVEES